MTQTDPRVQAARRAFLFQAISSVGIALSASAIATIVAGCETDETTAPDVQGLTIKIDDYPELASVGGIASVAIEGLNDGFPVFISRIDSATFAVFSAECTHQGCEVFIETQESPTLICPCHDALYSKVDGSVVQQPNVGSATDLKRFASSYNSSSRVLTINP